MNGICQAGIDRCSCCPHNTQYIHKSSGANKLLRDSQTDAGVKVPLKTITEVSKSWDSAQAMVDRNLHLEDHIRKVSETPFVVKNKPELTDLIAAGTEKRLHQDFLSITTTIAASTNALSSSNRVSASSAIPSQLKINKKLKIKDTDTPSMVEVKTLMADNFSKRDTLTNTNLQLATILDSSTRRYIKDDQTAILLPAAHAQAKKDFASKSLRDAIPPLDSTAPPPSKKSRLSKISYSTINSWLADSDDSDESETDEPVSTLSPLGFAKAEVERYLQMPYPKDVIDFDVIAWWRKNHHAFPTLEPIARKVLAIQAGGSPIERTWSTAGLIANDLRSSLSGTNLSSLIFLNKNR